MDFNRLPKAAKIVIGILVLGVIGMIINACNPKKEPEQKPDTVAVVTTSAAPTQPATPEKTPEEIAAEEAAKEQERAQEQAEREQREAERQERLRTMTVYVTQSGSKYHTDDNCSGLNGSTNLTQMTREEAIAQGYEPCDKCSARSEAWA